MSAKQKINLYSTAADLSILLLPFISALTSPLSDFDKCSKILELTK